MKLDLKDFQERAVRRLLDEVQKTRAFRQMFGEEQAVVLASPTGSGKTIAMLALLERLYWGFDKWRADPQATFLWLSDSPELNEQSRSKALAYSDKFRPSQLETVSTTFDAEVFAPGQVYFLNTQKLAITSNLTQRRDGRQWTIWETIANTARRSPESFFVIIDEAHRGMSLNASNNDRSALTIVQKFIRGDAVLGVPAIPFIIGMSATPRRFDELLGTTTRNVRRVPIHAADVRGSGLLKERVVVSFSASDLPSDISLLREAVRDWARYRSEWRAYAQQQGQRRNFSPQEAEAERVEPVLVVQVQDGANGSASTARARAAASPTRAAPTTPAVLSRTNLEEVVMALQQECEAQNVNLGPHSICHCFNGVGDIVLAGRNISYIEPNKIQDDGLVRVVLFKSALSTGWDCPRAEVMMSFRSAQDATNIAQLIGRMVRTPLARTVGSNEFLNTVRLYLPHYNAGEVMEVLRSLADPGAENTTGVDKEKVTDARETVEYQRRPDVPDDVWEHLESLPSYQVPRRPVRRSEAERLLALSRLIHLEKLDGAGSPTGRLDEWIDAKAMILNILREHWDTLPPEEKSKARSYAVIDVRDITFQVGDWHVVYDILPEPTGDQGKAIDTEKRRQVLMSPENIDDMFEECGRQLAKGEDIHRMWWKAMADEINPDDPYAAKLALYLVTRSADVAERLRSECQGRIDSLFDAYGPAIRSLSEKKREKFRVLRAQGRKPEPFALTMPQVLVAKRNGQETSFAKHLFCDEDGQFAVPLDSSWEQAVIEKAVADPAYIGWLRNEPNKLWALCVPYETGGEHKATYPDFLLLRRLGGHLICDIVEPHTMSLADAPAKAKGMAMFAKQHGEDFGRILLGAQFLGEMKWLDVQKEDVQNALLLVDTIDSLRSVYEVRGIKQW